MSGRSPWDEFWDAEDPKADSRDEAEVSAVKIARIRAAGDTITRFGTVLTQVFPRGTLLDRDRKNAGRLDSPTAMIEIGHHYVGITASVTPDGSDTKLEAFWRRNISLGADGAGRPVSQEMGNHPIRSEAGFGAWLSRTFAKMVESAAGDIRTAIHPDNVFGGAMSSAIALPALRGGQLLRQLNVTANTVTEKVAQPLPWSNQIDNQGRTTYLVRLLSGGQAAGAIGLRWDEALKAWKFALRITLQNHVQPPAKDMVFATETKATWGPPDFQPNGPVPPMTLDEAKARAEAYYATHMASALIEQARPTR